MADLKHYAQMADSKCHQPIRFLFPEYANDRYTIQRDARSIGFFSWVVGLVGPLPGLKRILQIGCIYNSEMKYIIFYKMIQLFIFENILYSILTS